MFHDFGHDRQFEQSLAESYSMTNHLPQRGGLTVSKAAKIKRYHLVGTGGIYGFVGGSGSDGSSDNGDPTPNAY